MIYSFTLTARQEAIIQAKVAAVTTKEKPETRQSLLDFKLTEYIAACERDVGQSIDARIAKAIAAKDTAAKQALLTTLEAV